MPRPTTSDRTRLSVGAGMERIAPSPVVPREVPTIKPRMTGLEALSAAFDGFYRGASNALDMVSRADELRQQGEMQVRHSQQQGEIEAQGVELRKAARRRSEENQAAATAAAMRGDELPENLRSDYDAADAYTKTKGRVDGITMSAQLEQEVANLGPTDDVDAFVDNWMKENVLAGIESTDPLYQVEMLAPLKETAIKVREGHKERAYKYHVTVGRDNLANEIANSASTADIADLNDLRARAAPLFPDDPGAANAFVVSNLIGGARGNYAALNNVVELLKAPGSWDGERSWAEAQPLVVQEAEAEAVNALHHTASWEATKEFDQIERDITTVDLSTPEGETQYRLLMNRLDETEKTYGRSPRADAIRNTLAKQAEPYVKQQVVVNRMDGMRTGQLPMDVSEVKKNQDTYFAAIGVDPIAQPVEAAAVVDQFGGVVSQNLTHRLSVSIGSGSPESAEGSFMFVRSLEERLGTERALATLDQSARADYLALRSLQEMSRKPFGEVLTEYRANRADFSAAIKKPLSDLTGLTPSEASVQFTKAVRGSLKSIFGEDVEVPPTMLAEFERQAKVQHFGRLSGQGDWKSSTQQAVLASAPGLSVHPGPNGKLVVTKTELPDGPVPKYGPDGLQEVGPDGKGASEELLPFSTKVRNPHTGKDESTIETAKDDLDGLRDVFGDASNVDPEGFHLDGRSQWASRGFWLVKDNDGNPVHLTRQDAQKYIDGAELVPGSRDRFSLAPLNPDGTGGYILLYRPGYREIPPTLQELEAGGDVPKASLMSPEDKARFKGEYLTPFP